MATITRPRAKKYYTVDEANASLPLVRSILRDLTTLARDLRERHQRLLRSQATGTMDKAHEEELQQQVAEYERDHDRLREYEDELKELHVELKDYFSGLVDFPCWMDDHEVYLCWRLDEPTVGHWHELDAGFAGRKKLTQ